MKSALVFLCLILALCVSTEASMQKVLRANVRGSMKIAARGHKDGDDNDDNDDTKAVEGEGLKKKLAANFREQSQLQSKIEDLANETKSDREIEASAQLAANETESPAMGHMLGKMWKDMRMFETPLYTERVEEEIEDLKREQKALELKLKAGNGESIVDDRHGSEDCRCVGIDEIEGETVISLKKHGKVSFPADLGARCEAWDAETHPGCPGESWCAQEWCYVDPCKCKNVADLPKPSAYLPNGKYQGKPVHFSYATCGGKDSFSAEEEKKTAEDLEATCAVEVDSSKWGAEKCRCVGVGPQPGSTKVNIKGKQVDFPADVGSTCNAWEADNHPDCSSDEPPSWCSQSWCYVDPCSCNLETPPKTSNYVPDANYQGKPVYYSYATCGASDSWSTGRKDACVNQKSSGECGKLEKCAWTGTECLGKELVDVCDLEQSANAKSSAWGQKAIVALALPLLGLFY